jgi:hypothetical protein
MLYDWGDNGDRSIGFGDVDCPEINETYMPLDETPIPRGRTATSISARKSTRILSSVLVAGVRYGTRTLRLASRSLSGAAWVSALKATAVRVTSLENESIFKESGGEKECEV